MGYTRGPGPLSVDYDPMVEKLKGDIGIVENGTTATHAIAKGQYVIWNGSLYIAKADIAVGTAFVAGSGGNLTAKGNGIGDDVFGIQKVVDTMIYGKPLANNTDLDTVRQCGKYCILQGSTITSLKNRPDGVGSGEMCMYVVSHSQYTVQGANVDYGFQLLFHSTSNSENIYIRAIVNGVVKSWRKITTETVNTVNVPT